MAILEDMDNFETQTSSNFEEKICASQDLLDSCRTSLINNASDSLNVALDATFAGLSDDEINTLIGPNGAIEKYCVELDSIVNAFDESRVDAGSAFRGQIKTEIEGFVEGGKQLIHAYISNLRQFRKDADEYRNAYKKAVDEDISQDINKATSEITQKASEIKFDELG